MDKDYRPPRRRPRTNARETAWQQTVHNQSVGNRDRRSEAAQAVPARVVRRHPPHIYRRRRAAAIGIFVFMLLLIIFLAGCLRSGTDPDTAG